MKEEDPYKNGEEIIDTLIEVKVMPEGKRRDECLETGRKPVHKRRRKHWKS